MRFARVVFWIAGIWGVLVITPLLFIFDLIGRQDPPPITHPGFYYGFGTTALAWQIAFFIIAREPRRLRPLMLASILEKFGYATGVIVLFVERRIRGGDLAFGCVDLLFGVLFILAYQKTPAIEVQH
jgi:hypothetical protein